MDERHQGKTTKVYIIDPVGKKAGLDHYDDSLAAVLNDAAVSVKVFGNYSSGFSENVFPFTFGSSVSGFFGMLLSFLKIIKKVKLHPPDFIILHFFRATKLSLWFWRRLKRSGAKFIVIYHDVESLLFTDKTDTDLRSHLELSDLIVVHNQFSRDELQQKYPFVKDKITIIPHGDFNGLPSAISKSEARKKLNIDENIPLVLFFGMIKPSKGLDTLLKAMLNADAKLIIAGRLRNCNLSDFDKPMKVLLQQEKLITDIGYIASDKRDLYLKAADMIVLPYKKIYQSGVLLMALSYGLPVIASDLLPNKEFSEPLKSVLLFRTGDAEDLAEKINHLLGDPDARESLRINGVQKLKKDHSWKTIGSIYSKIISE